MSEKKAAQLKSHKFDLDEATMPALIDLADGMPGGFFVYEARGNEEILYYNKALMHILGCETKAEFEELTGNSFKGIVYGEDYDHIEDSIWRQIKHSKNDLDFVEYRIKRKDGEIRWVEDYGHYRKTDYYGEVFYVFVQDNTERMMERVKRLEKINHELEVSNARENQFKKAILYDAITFFEINITHNGFVNSAMHELDGILVDSFSYLGIPRFDKYSDYVDYLIEHAEEDEKESYREFFRTERLTHCYEIGELEQSFESWSTDYLGRKRLCKFVILLGKDENTGDIVALSLAKDVTDQLERQRLLEMALVQANAATVARQTFLSSMSHDIRTPLNSIIGFSELMMSHVSEENKVLEYADKIKRSGEQLLSIFMESLEITRMESGRVELEVHPGSIPDLLFEIERNFVPELTKKNISLTVNTVDITHPDVIFDTIRFREILSQLVDNAIKYTHEGGAIVFTAEEIPSNNKNMASFRFSVKDNGIGMSEEFMGRIFKNFERENNSTLSGVLGSGLGLAVVKNMVDMMEGTIEVESELGKGSTFTVTVSLDLIPTGNFLKNMQEEETHKVELKGRKLLLVEDNEINMEIARELLEQCEFVVDTAENGLVAVKKMEENPAGTYDVILMDLQMPVMDGYQATKAIRKLGVGKGKIPIIAVSANAFSEDRERCIAAGMNAHCPKPIHIGQLKEMIARTLDNAENKKYVENHK